ncbi:MAG: hypothetical protein CVU95_06685 [Firmicutes bacterium HGW-Firmicutes-2]|jgi:hypothetical protein|nr:MAG: hypothetical protein CVU95_06685 [Firmicutes bacterium HGW-Firmicutes-2]
MELQIIIIQISKLILLVLVGVYARKLKIIPEEGIAILSKLLIHITLPILTFFSITSYKLPENIFRDGFFIICMGVIIQLFSLFTGKIIAKKLKLDRVKKNVYAAQLMIGNTVYLAFPLMTDLFGNIGLIYAIVYYLVSLTFIWTIGVYLFNKDEMKNIRHIFKSLVNPCTIAFALGVIALILRIDIAMDKWVLFRNTYQFMYDTFYPLGNTTMSLSMVFIGLIIGQMEFKQILGIFKDRSVQILVLVKLIVIPGFFLLVLLFAKEIASEIAIAVIFIETLMPASTVTVAIAKENGSDYTYAMEIAIATTIICLITIPVMLRLYQVVL